MWKNFNVFLQRIKLRARLLNPSKAVFTTGLVFYVGVVGTWVYFNPESLLQSTTKTVHQISRISIPKFARGWVYSMYSQRYGVNLQEVQKPLSEYNNLNQFFTRRITNRLITPNSVENRMILAPSDSTILSISEVTQNNPLIVKGITYSLSQLLFQVKDTNNSKIINELKVNPNSKLYQVILYLSPGDYHRFHSPTNIQVKSLRNIQGKVRPVNLKTIQQFGGSVYEENSRKIVHSVYRFPGQKNHNYLGLAFIAALNVSDTEIYRQTSFEAGQEIGKFNMGSTIVMLIEAGDEVIWKCEGGQKVKYGEILCECKKQ